LHLSLAIILGLTGAVCWGTADFAARFASRRVGAFRTLFLMQVFGFIALSIYLKLHGGFFAGVAPGRKPWVLAVVAGLINMSASLSLYYSFQIGVMSVVGPVSSSYPALTVARHPQRRTHHGAVRIGSGRHDSRRNSCGYLVRTKLFWPGEQDERSDKSRSGWRG